MLRNQSELACMHSIKERRLSISMKRQKNQKQINNNQKIKQKLTNDQIKNIIENQPIVLIKKNFNYLIGETLDKDKKKQDIKKSKENDMDKNEFSFSFLNSSFIFSLSSTEIYEAIKNDL